MSFRHAFSAFFLDIYYNLQVILTTHVNVRLRGLLPVPSNTSWDHQPVVLRQFDHSSGIISTLMQPESWLKGINAEAATFEDICRHFYSYP